MEARVQQVSQITTFVSLKTLTQSLWPTCQSVCRGSWSIFHCYLQLYQPESQYMFISSRLRSFVFGCVFIILHPRLSKSNRIHVIFIYSLMFVYDEHGSVNPHTTERVCASVCMYLLSLSLFRPLCAVCLQALSRSVWAIMCP